MTDPAAAPPADGAHRAFGVSVLAPVAHLAVPATPGSGFAGCYSAFQACQRSMWIHALTRLRSRVGYGLPV